MEIHSQVVRASTQEAVWRLGEQRARRGAVEQGLGAGLEGWLTDQWRRGIVSAATLTESQEAYVEDKDVIITTVNDYWEGWFEGDAERMDRALHPALAKTGIGIDASGLLITESMTAEDMIGWTRGGAGIAEKPADSAFEVTINDTYHAIATVTVQSGIYREYLHLVKTALGWKILNALYMRVREE